MTLALTDNHLRALAAIGHALALHTDVEAWRCLVPILVAKLTPYERGCLAVVCLAAAEDEQVFAILESVVADRYAGSPLPPLIDSDTEALWWAEMANPAELKSYVTACFARLSPRDQSGFLAAATRRSAA